MDAEIADSNRVHSKTDHVSSIFWASVFEGWC